MAVPEVLNATVTSAVVATDKVAVNVRDEPAFSAIDVALVARVTVGADSFSEIVILCCCVPFSVTPDLPETPLISIVAVSSSSYTLSSVGSKVAVPVVAPALIVISEIVP